MKIETLKAILQAFHTASNDAARPNLNAVFLERDGTHGGRVRITATDAHVLSCVSVDDDDTALLIQPGERFAVTPQNAAILKLVMKSMKSAPGVFDERRGESIVLKADGLECEIKSCASAQISPPDFDRILNATTGEDSQTIAFDAELLMDLAKALQNGNKRHGVVITIAGPKNAIKVHLQDHPERRGVLMPRRM